MRHARPARPVAVGPRLRGAPDGRRSPGSAEVPPASPGRRHMADAFRTQVLQNKDADNSPVVTLGSCTFLYTREVRRGRAAATVAGDASAPTRSPATAEQRVPAGADAGQHERGGRVPLPAAGASRRGVAALRRALTSSPPGGCSVQELLRRVRRGLHTRQLRAHLRAAGRRALFAVLLPSPRFAHSRDAAEIVDNGYPQIVTAESLKVYITQQARCTGEWRVEAT